MFINVKKYGHGYLHQDMSFFKLLSRYILMLWACSIIKMWSCWCRNSNYKDKMVSQQSCLYNGNPYTLKESLHTEMVLKFQLYINCPLCFLMFQWETVTDEAAVCQMSPDASHASQMPPRIHGRWQRLTESVAADSGWLTGGHLNIKMPSYQCMGPHVKDKTVLRPSYL